MRVISDLDALRWKQCNAYFENNYNWHRHIIVRQMIYYCTTCKDEIKHYFKQLTFENVNLGCFVILYIVISNWNLPKAVKYNFTVQWDYKYEDLETWNCHVLLMHSAALNKNILELFWNKSLFKDQKHKEPKVNSSFGEKHDKKYSWQHKNDNIIALALQTVQK